MPLTSTSISAGRVTIAAQTPTKTTALAGTRVAVSFASVFEPGIAPSRLNANVIRDADVMHDVAQKNCADAEMNSTRVAQFVAERLHEDRLRRLRRPARCRGCRSASFGIANTTHSSRM